MTQYSLRFRNLFQVILMADLYGYLTVWDWFLTTDGPMLKMLSKLKAYIGLRNEMVLSVLLATNSLINWLKFLAQIHFDILGCQTIFQVSQHAKLEQTLRKIVV